MHFTVTPRGNGLLILLWFGVLAACALTEPRLSIAVAVAFLFAGFVAGALQGQAIRQFATQFLAAGTARQVRAALVSSLSGKLSVGLLWLAGIAVLTLLVRGGEYGTLQTGLGSYAAFSLARELASLPAVIALPRLG